MINNEQAGTRFDERNPLGKAVRSIFGDESLVNAVTKFDKEVKAHGVTPMEVAIRWIAHHAALNDEDGIILGASKTAQVLETVALLRKGPLPPEVLKLTEELWDAVKETRGEII